LRFLLPHAVDHAAQRNAESCAIRFGNETLSYAGLAAKANRLAHVLVDHGVKRGDRVGIYLHKCMASAIALYGIMKAGAAYVPLDPSAPHARTAFAIKDCGIKHLVTENSKTSAIGKIAASGTRVDFLIGPDHAQDSPATIISRDQVASARADSPPDTGTTEQDLAYIMYTSGSTGHPKGIMHTHHSGLSYARWAANEYKIEPSDRLTNHAPLHFDLSTFDFFAGAIAGATTVIVPEEVPKFPASYAQLLADERITIFFTVPFALIQLLLRGALDRHDLSSLRWIVFGGEPFPTKHLRALMATLPHARFSNIYGPAEVNGVTFYHVPDLPQDRNEPIPIGTLCPNVEGLVVDQDAQQVPRGESGELLIRSPTMMQSYWQRPDLNEKAFYRRPITDNYEHVFYRTGDIVRLEPDGNYAFLGRQDRQIKIRGYRVELDEIEAALVAHEQVEEAAVVVIADPQGSHHIHAAVTLKSGTILSPANLLKHAAEKLPPYAIPAVFQTVDAFPRTSSGKIDRRALHEQIILESV